MEKLLQKIEEYKTKFNLEKEFKKLKDNVRVYPFSYELDCLSFLLSKNLISFAEYTQLENNYTNNNKYLYLYDLAPRTFGETWGEQHILSLFPQFKKETRNFNEKFDGEYDLVVKDIRVEVKACRANENGDSSLTSRAYNHQQAMNCNFKYHFQQLKPSCCDVFIWIGVCKDELIYWILTSEELKNTGKLSPQHRNENTGLNTDIFEGQVFMTEIDLEKFKINESEILNKVIEKGTK